MTKKERPTKPKKTQHEKFVELARQLGVEEDENAFVGKLKKIAPPKPPKNKGS